MPPRDRPILTVEGLSKSFPGRRDALDVIKRHAPRLVAVDDVSFELRTHETLGVVGESGSGKSTLAKCLVRLHEPDTGRIALGSTDLRAAKGRDLARARRSMQLIYQDPFSSLNPLLTVEQAVSEPARVHGCIPVDRTATDYTGELLDLVGLSRQLASRRPVELSGGQRQRVAIARAMVLQPEILIADEPVSALDVSIQAQVLKLFETLRSERGVAVIFIAHQLSVVAHIAERVMVMYLGRVVESGPAATVFGEPGHPYTVGLLQSQPGPHRRDRRHDPALKGEIPSPLKIPSGCRFRTRCPMAQDICKNVDPPPVDLGNGHTAWCHFAAQLAPTAARPRVTSADRQI